MRPKSHLLYNKSMLILPNKDKLELELFQTLSVILMYTDQMDVILKESFHVFQDMKLQELLKVSEKELLEFKLEIQLYHAILLNVIKKNVSIVNIKHQTCVQKLDLLKVTDLCLMELQDLEPNKEKLYSISWVVQLLLNTL